MSCRRRRNGGPHRRPFVEGTQESFPHMNVYRCYHPGTCNNDCVLLNPDDDFPRRRCRRRE